MDAEPDKNEYPWSFSPTIGDDYVKTHPRKLMEISEFINYEVSIKFIISMYLLYRTSKNYNCK